MRSSIPGQMGAIPVVAFGLLAIRGATPPARWLVTGETCLFSLIGLLTASTQRRWRFAWAAFGLGGSLDLALCFGPGLDLREVEYLPSSAALDRLFPVLFPQSYVYDLALEREYCTCYECVAGVRNGLQAGFVAAGQVVCALLAAALSGLAALGLSSYHMVGLRSEAGTKPNTAIQRTRGAGR